MAYTFKLARRLAQAHVVACALVLASCQDSAAPSETSFVPQLGKDALTGGPPVRVLVRPRSVDIASFDTLQLRLHARDGSGRSYQLPAGEVSWTASGGTISEDGVYFGGITPGDFQVIGTHLATGLADTVPVTLSGGGSAIVNGNGYVVKLIKLQPGTLTLATGASATLVVDARSTSGVKYRLSSDSVTWSATGGTIAKGKYTAGSSAGQYRVIAVHGPTGAADTVPVTVTGGSAPPPPPPSNPGSSVTPVSSGSGACRNQPSGYGVVQDESFNTKPVQYPVLIANTWQILSQAGRFTIQSDPTAPTRGKVIEGRFAKGTRGGTAPFRMDLSLGGSPSAVYMCLSTKISSNFTANGNAGVKFGFFVTPYDWSKPQGINHYVNLYPRLGVNLQFKDPSLNHNYTSSFSFSNHLDEWHIVEVLVVGNSQGASNGTAKIWVDGALVLNSSGIQYFYSTQSPKFTKVTWNPTYGGGSNPVPADQFQWIDGWFVSTR